MTPRILLVRFSSLGDVILTTPLVRAIGTRHPGAEITFVTKRRYAPVFEGNPHVSRIESLGPGESVRSLAGRLRQSRFDHQLDLHGNLRSALLRRALGGHWTGYDKRRGERRRLIWLRRAPRAVVPVPERYFEAARALEVEPDGAPAEVFTSGVDQAAARAMIAAPYVVLAPGAQDATRRWPASHWAALADLLLGGGLGVVGAGTLDERRLLPHPGITSAFGASLGVTAALMREARTVVGNDSGLTHLATAVRARVIALFGPTVQEFGFAPYRARGAVVETRRWCRPCAHTGGAICPLLHHRCMRDISPRAVADVVAVA